MKSRFTFAGGCWLVWGLVLLGVGRAATPVYTVQPVDGEGFDVYADGVRVAPVRLANSGAIVAGRVEAIGAGLRLSALRCRDPLAVTFSTNDFVAIDLLTAGGQPPEPVVRFQLSLLSFNAARWRALFPDGAAPFHFLACSVPTAQVWHQRGWLNATPGADRFPLLDDVHVGAPEISCLWNRNWSYLCPLGAHPIPVIGAWDPAGRLYVGYDFQEARATDQSERYLATAYCWQQGTNRSFITLAFPYGGLRYGEQVYPKGGEVLASRFCLIVDVNLPGTEDPNERFQARLFERYADLLPLVPSMNDMSWLPGSGRSTDFPGAAGLGLWGAGGETTFYPEGTLLVHGWGGHRELPIDAAVRRGDTAAIAQARTRIEALLATYGRTFTAGGEACLFWEKPLAGAWRDTWGGAGVTTLHNADGWYPARVLVELYRYDRARGQAKAEYAAAIDSLFNWAKHFVWTRNEFADVPSSPFAIGGTLCTAFLLDYHFTFRNDAQRQANAQRALHLANRVLWRYLPVWAMDSDRFDGAIDSSFLVEPNSGRDWAGLACSNEVNWVLDALTQVYVHTGDPRLRYYLRGMLDRWPVLYRPVYEDSIEDYGSDALTEGLGLFDGSGPGRGNRYNYGFTQPLPLNEPIGNSRVRVVAGIQACIAFTKHGSHSDVTDYRTDGNGGCAFTLASSLGGAFDVSYSYPFVDVSRFSVRVLRNGVTRSLGSDEVTRPTHAPSSLYIKQLRAGDTVTIGNLAPTAPVIPIEAPRTYRDTNGPPRTVGAFALLSVASDQVLTQDWTDLHSFAGLVAGERWLYGVPYWQSPRATTNTTALEASGARALLLAYAPPEDRVLEQAPGLVLDDGSPLALSGKPFLAWRGWPPIFTRVILGDYAVVPEGRTVRQVQPRGTLVTAATAYRGDSAGWGSFEAVLVAAGAEFAAAEAQRRALIEVRARLAALPAGKIAVLPRPSGGAGAAFGAMSGLRDKWVQLTEAQLVDTNFFNPVRFPLALYLSGEDYVKTVNTTGDGKTAVARYLARRGTLVLLSSGPFPFFYGYGPGDQAGPADVLLPTLGLPIENAFESLPTALTMVPHTSQTILTSLPAPFAFPPGDPRLRSINRARLNPADRYVPLIRVVDSQGRDYGDAAGYLELKSGVAKGGRILYVWSSLTAGPQGQAVMSDTLTWILSGTLRVPEVSAIRVPSPGRVALGFDALPNLLYGVESRDSVVQGAWSLLASIAGGPTVRSLWWTNTVGSRPARFYRLSAQP